MRSEVLVVAELQADPAIVEGSTEGTLASTASGYTGAPEAMDD